MLELNSLLTSKRLIYGYGVAVLSVVSAAISLLLMEARWQLSVPVSMFLLAVIISSWLGGTKSGLLAAVLSILGFDYFLLHLGRSLADHPIDGIRLLSLGIVAFYVVWVTATERSAAQSLMRSHDELKRNIEALRAENVERERAEDALGQSQQLLNLVLATLPVGVLVTNQAGDIILANAAAERVSTHLPIVRGHERWAQSKGRWHDSGKSIAPSEWASARALSAGQTNLNELIDIETDDGRQKTIQNSSAPIRDMDGSIMGAVIVIEDVTERELAETALRESAKRLRYLSRRLLTVQEEERRHLSRELHDEFGQLLATITLHLQRAKAFAGETAQSSLEESMALLQRAGAQVRGLALELRPTMLETGGVEAALRWLVEQHEKCTGIPTEVVGHVSDVSGDPAIAAFRVAQEALTNVVRHARAQRAWIELSQKDGLLNLVVRDDGVGFNVTQTLERAAGAGNLGLLGMKERVEILGGTLEIDSQPRQGTRIRISLPSAEPIAVPGGHAA
jgi:signal transduction histidine kinase